MSVQKVFECDDLRKKILTYIPKRCRSCHTIMKAKLNTNILHYRNYAWRAAECTKMDNYCNWCYYYVFEYR